MFNRFFLIKVNKIVNKYKTPEINTFGRKYNFGLLILNKTEMKKIILSALAIFAFGFANAQDKGGSDSSITFGVKAGVQNTNFTGDDADTDAKTSFYVGGLVDFTVSESFHVQPELLYSMEGADNDLGISYLRIPIMAKYYVMEGLSLQAGPEVAFKIGTEEDGLDEITKSTDFGLGIGAGYELSNGLMFDLRYNMGLSSIYDGDGDVDIKNSGIALGLGYRF
ncbi:MAG TPA: porin family protein [Flavobacterium sp.]|nr:porin family protein [Flavobacterium sp.]